MEYNGVAEDIRTLEEKERDYKRSDLAGDIVPEWKEKTEWKRYTSREQNGSSSCMAQAGAKAFETLTGIVYSAHPPYRSRANYPSGGMWLQNLAQVYRGEGTTLETLDVSQRISEAEMNRDITVETPYEVKGYGFPTYNDIDDIAGAIEEHKHCILVVHCYHDEWLQPQPEYNGKDQSGYTFGHGICAVDYFIKDGKKCLLIEDSTGHSSSLDKEGARIVTEDFLKKRIVGAMYLTLEEPKYIFKTFMKRGYRSVEVKELQKRLNKELNLTLAVDGIFGRNTDKAVKQYQSQHGLVADGLVGPITRSVLNN